MNCNVAIMSTTMTATVLSGYSYIVYPERIIINTASITAAIAFSIFFSFLLICCEHILAFSSFLSYTLPTGYCRTRV